MDFSDIKNIFIQDKRVTELNIDGNILWRGLPRGYIELDYIETNGTQYINTGFAPNQDSRVVCEIAWVSGTNVAGARASTSSRNFCIRIISGKWQLCHGTQLATGTIGVTANSWVTLDINKNSLYVDGELAITATKESFTTPRNFALGAIHASSRTEPYFGNSRYRSCKIYDDSGKLVRKFIPCKNPDGVIGMYDSINDNFYSNAGTGDFIAGSIILPFGYTELDYIETNGTQYLDTGFAPNQDSRVVCEMAWISGSNVLGARSTTSSKNFCIRAYTNWQLCYGTQLTTGTIEATANSWVTLDINKNSLYVNGELAVTATKESFTAPRNFALGAIRASRDEPYFGNSRYRSCKIYDNDILVRDLIPCRSDKGETGMYDLLNSKFYGNAGSGGFIVGFK